MVYESIRHNSTRAKQHLQQRALELETNYSQEYSEKMFPLVRNFTNAHSHKLVLANSKLPSFNHQTFPPSQDIFNDTAAANLTTSH